MASRSGDRLQFKFSAEFLSVAEIRSVKDLESLLSCLVADNPNVAREKEMTARGLTSQQQSSTPGTKL